MWIAQKINECSQAQARRTIKLLLYLVCESVKVFLKADDPRKNTKKTHNSLYASVEGVKSEAVHKAPPAQPSPLSPQAEHTHPFSLCLDSGGV